MQMQFTIARWKVLLQGSTSSELRALESDTISRTLRQSDGRGIILQLCAIQHGHTNQKELLSDAMAPLLIEFSELFEAPTRLPPPHSHDHRIPLQPGAGPICVCPYRSPHFHKQEIECLVKEMLSQGIIWPSQSPFSSSVLLVWKHDGSWRFFVDYWALSQVIVKD